jgi:hypothetical protein
MNAEGTAFGKRNQEEDAEQHREQKQVDEHRSLATLQLLAQ